MKVKLLSHTPDALNLLLRTKNTRLAFNDDPTQWDEEKKSEHLAYMRDTIKSSWEFIDYTFEINEVTRAFTHQLVRTRAGSYAQESQRTIDASENGYLNPFSEFHNVDREFFDEAAAHAFDAYKAMLESGVPAQDARGILPTATYTSIIAKFSLRTLHDMALTRLCVRTQGEYQMVFRAMRQVVLDVHPWAADFMQVACVQNGTCAFPRYGKEQCPVYLPEMDQSLVKLQAHQIFWSSPMHEARPVAKGGKTM